MKYIEVTIYTSIKGIDHVSNMLMDMGIDGFITESPEDIDDLINKKNKYEWDYIDEEVLNKKNMEPNIKFYIENSDEGIKTLEALRLKAMFLKGNEYEGAFSKDVNLGRMYVEDKIVDDEDWKDNWKEFFKTARVSNRLVIKPSWEEYEKENIEDLVIAIDPGMAFGTGTHATTSLCLKLLEKYIRNNFRVLDIGCGSGILSIASGLLGAKETLGIEIDPVAIDVAKENVELNNLSSIVDIKLGDLTKGIDFIADIVVANLMADLVVALTEDVGRHLAENGVYISSGILIEKKEMVSEKLNLLGFEIIEIVEQDEWCAIAARPRS